MTSPLLTESDLRDFLSLKIAVKYGNTQSRWARKYRIRAAAVSSFLNGAAPTEKIVAALGAEKECGYRMKDSHENNMRQSSKSNPG